MINETSIRCFLSLARTLNFTETARQMYMTQQSVSKYIAKLERIWALSCLTSPTITRCGPGEGELSAFFRV